MIDNDLAPPRGEPRAVGWEHSLASGAVGIALLHIERAHAGLGTWETAYEWAAAMTRNPIAAHPDACSLFEGAPAVAFALHAARQPAFASALDILDGPIADATRHRLECAHERIDRGQLPTIREFDLISGLTGVGVYLFHRCNHEDLVQDVLTYLVRLVEPVKINGEVLPGWWCNQSPGSQPAHRWPGGHGNLGMAHGIAGPLALLSTTLRRGITVAGQAEAIEQICAWLDHWRCDTDLATWWPGMISLAERRTGHVRQAGPQRPSWCYGTPGLARAQQLAAITLDDRQRQRQAEQALVGCITDEDQLARVTDASLCHGWAGLRQATRRVASDERCLDDFAIHVPRLATRMKRHLHERRQPSHEGLLEGRAGVDLARLAPAAATTSWDACMLLAG